MNIYIKNQRGDELIEKGELLAIGGAKRVAITTGRSMQEAYLLGVYKDEEQTKEVFDYIVDRITNPNEKELKKGCIYIDLCELDKNISSQE